QVAVQVVVDLPAPPLHLFESQPIALLVLLVLRRQAASEPSAVVVGLERHRVLWIPEPRREERDVLRLAALRAAPLLVVVALRAARGRLLDDRGTLERGDRLAQRDERALGVRPQRDLG